ncbi:hypothetical protein GCM10017566_50800 [Amycolatopsis bartoniae]|uniref:Family 43 glycosylhydrolase n=1 Tax=Amycolatopsis bartoniae TaxID=941986 RepID=A0A8H9J0W0_9PSEU|nr:hypothetical protein GCM10017566_50800 [Amycolatopsis bartoniae]
MALLVALTVLASLACRTASAAAGADFTLTGLDLHDGKLVQTGSTYYLYGTEYGCGFTWGQAGTPWCGFGVSTSTDKVTWSAATILFSPHDIDSWTGTTWTVECGSTGAGCFNPRMIQRTGWGADDGSWLLWFNAPADYNRSGANAYYALSCTGPAGPCGSPHKPSLSVCGGNGDFDVLTRTGAGPVLLCTQADQTLSSEQLDQWGTDGTGAGANDLAGLTAVESPSAYHDTAHDLWIMTYSDPNCGYCSGDGTGYATATSPLGPWTAPANSGVSAPATGRRDLSATSCGGQPRAVSFVDGRPYQGIDLWNGSLDETAAPVHFEQLVYTAPSPAAAPWQPFRPWTCD